MNSPRVYLLGVSGWPTCFMATEWALKSSELGFEFLLHHLPAADLEEII